MKIATIFLSKRLYIYRIFLLILSFMFIESSESTNSNIVYAAKSVSRGITTIEDGNIEILALHLAYPERISKPKKYNSSLGFYFDDVWYYWANGKILTEDDILNEDKYSPYPFYVYESYMPILPEKNDINKVLINEEYEKRKRQNPRNTKFLDRLYNAKTLNSIEKDIVLIRLLGFNVRVNKSIAPILEKVEKEINIMTKTDKEVSVFLSSLKTVSGYVLKDIAKSQNVSYHSYGVAFDTLPKNNRKAVYWSWSRVNNKNWYAIPYNERWTPAKKVIDVFEKNGFIWGGKWLFFDTIHFEYRPEIMYYNKLLLDRNMALKLLSQK